MPQRPEGRHPLPRNDKFRIFALSLDGTKLGVLEELLRRGAALHRGQQRGGGVEAPIHPILVALGKREPVDVEDHAPHSRWKNSSSNLPT